MAFADTLFLVFLSGQAPSNSRLEGLGRLLGLVNQGIFATCHAY